VERLVVVGSVGLGFGGGVWPAGVVAAALVVAVRCRLREASGHLGLWHRPRARAPWLRSRQESWWERGGRLAARVGGGRRVRRLGFWWAEGDDPL
jgi:predicted trehalose synthase